MKKEIRKKIKINDIETEVILPKGMSLADLPDEINTLSKVKEKSKMRYCIVCEKPMYTSIESIWINKKNYDCHKKCKKENKQ